MYGTVRTVVWEGRSGDPVHGEPYTGTKPETADTAKGTHLKQSRAAPYPIRRSISSSVGQETMATNLRIVPN